MGAATAIQASYFVAAALFIFGLKRMSSPVTARSGIVWAGVGMVVATLITFLTPGMGNYALMTVAIAVGGVAAWVTGRRVAMTDMPQMIALYNGMGGGAAGAIAAVELFSGEVHGVAFSPSGTGGILLFAMCVVSTATCWVAVQTWRLFKPSSASSSGPAPAGGDATGPS